MTDNIISPYPPILGIRLWGKKIYQQNLLVTSQNSPSRFLRSASSSLIKFKGCTKIQNKLTHQCHHLTYQQVHQCSEIQICEFLLSASLDQLPVYGARRQNSKLIFCLMRTLAFL